MKSEHLHHCTCGVPLLLRSDGRCPGRLRSGTSLRIRASGFTLGHERGGMTLFEVLLALTIFAGSAAVIGQLLSAGVRGALHARAHTEAVLRCESKLGEVIAGVQAFQAANDVPFPDDPDWSWSMTINNGPHQNLLLVEVTTKFVGAEESGDVTFTLHRLMRNPQTLFSAVAASAQAAANAAATNSSTPTSSMGTGSSTTGSK